MVTVFVLLYRPLLFWHLKSNKKSGCKKRIEKECNKKIFRTKNQDLLTMSKKILEHLSLENSKKNLIPFNLKLKGIKIYTIILY
ncbi:hypothetical protein HMPREF9163_00402 [Selenomonas sp. oral taxon 138 str. F0429]|nr:hypothetical protein HMPREF9163_00402 [Selenomonas sp. oral taxon 138 str. F0429]